MFDTHAHLADARFYKDRNKVINRAMQEGVTGIICVCSDFEELDVFYRLLDKYDFIYGAAGIHPHNASQYRKWESKLKDILTHHKIVALGEIGLDYYYQRSPDDVQREVFRSQLILAKKRDLPVIIHSREAMEDTLDILSREEITRGVMHCFSGNEKDMEFCVKMGLYISLAGPVTFPGALKLQKITPLIPLSNLLIETDSPYLAPQPVRGKRNEPLFLRYIIQKVASLKEIPERELSQVTSHNARKLFNLLPD